MQYYVILFFFVSFVHTLKKFFGLCITSIVNLVCMVKVVFFCPINKLQLILEEDFIASRFIILSRVRPNNVIKEKLFTMYTKKLYIVCTLDTVHVR